PSCLPAFENGGQGMPAATRSTPSYGWAENGGEMLASTTFQLGRFRRSVSHAWWSLSTSATCSKPARSSPSAWPPAPAHSSSEVSRRVKRSPVCGGPLPDLSVPRYDLRLL